MTSRMYQSEDGNKQEENNLKMLLSWHLKQLNEEDIKEKQKKRRELSFSGLKFYLTISFFLTIYHFFF